jgi:hypothetical protein
MNATVHHLHNARPIAAFVREGPLVDSRDASRSESPVFRGELEISQYLAGGYNAYRCS